MDPLYFPPLTHDIPLSVFYPALLQYMVTWRSLCVRATPCLERSRRHKEEVRVYLFYSSLSQATLRLMLLIRLLYMFTHTPSGMIMFPAHVVVPEVREEHSPTRRADTDVKQVAPDLSDTYLPLCSALVCCP